VWDVDRARLLESLMQKAQDMRGVRRSKQPNGRRGVEIDLKLFWSHAFKSIRENPRDRRAM